MKCKIVRSRGSFAIVCGGRRKKQPPCYRCGRPASIQCGKVVRWEDAGVAMKPITCDRRCCNAPTCAMKTGPNRHHCRQHYDEAAARSAGQR